MSLGTVRSAFLLNRYPKADFPRPGRHLGFTRDDQTFYFHIIYITAWSPSGKATVCKTVIHRFESDPGLHFSLLQKMTIL